MLLKITLVSILLVIFYFKKYYAQEIFVSV